MRIRNPISEKNWKNGERRRRRQPIINGFVDSIIFFFIIIVSSTKRTNGKCCHPNPSKSTRFAGLVPRLFVANVPANRRYQHGHVLQCHHHSNGWILRHIQSHLVVSSGGFCQFHLHISRHLFGGEGGQTSSHSRIPFGRRSVTGLPLCRIHDCRFQRLLRHGILQRQARSLQFRFVSDPPSFHFF